MPGTGFVFHGEIRTPNPGIFSGNFADVLKQASPGRQSDEAHNIAVSAFKFGFRFAAGVCRKRVFGVVDRLNAGRGFDL